jgi:hypothetical protein
MPKDPQKQSSGVGQNKGARTTSSNKVMGGGKEPKVVPFEHPIPGKTGISREELTQDANSVTLRSGKDRHRKSRNEP